MTPQTTRDIVYRGREHPLRYTHTDRVVYALTHPRVTLTRYILVLLFTVAVAYAVWASLLHPAIIEQRLHNARASYDTTLTDTYDRVDMAEKNGRDMTRAHNVIRESTSTVLRATNTHTIEKEEQRIRELAR